jgi:phage shock protein C
MVRPRGSRKIGGVCAGFAEYYGWDVTAVRWITVGITLLTGVTFFVYLAAWLILPEGAYALPPQTPPPPSSATESPVH